MSEERLLPDLDFAAIDFGALEGEDLSHWIAVLPLGATEQHGPHLPVETDTLIAGGISARLSKKVSGKLPVTFLPVQEIGYSPEHMDYPGSKSLTYDEAIEKWTAIGGMLAKRGICKLLLLNAHGGNSPLMTIVATELRVHKQMLCVATSWTRFGYPQSVIGPQDAALDIHAGLIETSLMLALHPNKVSMEKAQHFSSRQAHFISQNRHLAAYGKHAFGWKMQDLNPLGATGDAASATAEKGQKLLDHAVCSLADLLADIDRFDLSEFERQPDVQ
ncbi:creatininase family protein [Salaquimonas pukyongi]|uniref:creatininase family protein n=1 Tax=Salaquimonas pukyongi TaxID=2712698 RepID=UPI00096B7357|nr:creatininase family protein [Salaquimonas pukyongi]